MADAKKRILNISVPISSPTLALVAPSLESPTSPRQALLGCCMPQRAGEGSGARQKPKTNLETDEFTSNSPFSKI
jgi:hypothetical protein